MTRYHLAQLNIARALEPMDSDRLADFVGNLDRINALAESSPGFVWRLVGEGNDATDLDLFGDPLTISNMSVWTDMAALGAFVFRSAHREIMARRREWFEVPAEAYTVLWWTPEGHHPTPAEAVERLEHLRKTGPSAFAFTFKQPYPPQPDAAPVAPVLDECS